MELWHDRTKPTVCNYMCCHDMKKLLPDLWNESFALRLTNRAQSQVMQKFPSPPLQFLGNYGAEDRDALAETEAALRWFIIELAHISHARSQSAIEQPTVEQSTVEQPTVEQPTVEQPIVVQPAVVQ